MRKHLAQANFPASSRIAIFLAMSAILCATEIVSPRAPVFSDYPFDQWAAEPEHSAIKWEVHLLPPQLSVHQRLIERIQTVVPGGELAKRRGRGELVLLARFEDSDGRPWRAGSRLDLVKVQAGVKSQELTFTLAAFIKPGDYKVLVALIDSRTLEHSFTRRTLHVAPLKGDPLPTAWNGLPAVEVLPAVDGPDAWFLPAVKGLLHLPLTIDAENTVLAFNAEPETDAAWQGATAQKTAFTGKSSSFRHAIKATTEAPHIDLLINTTPSEWANSPAAALRRNMSVVIPALKVLSGLNVKIRPPSATVIDLTHQRTGFETANAASLDWNALGKLLAETNPAVIDAKSLSAQSTMREYFANEVARRAGDSGPARWLIVLSGPLVFARQDDTPPPVLLPDPRRHIIYMRFSPGFGSAPGADIQIAPVRRVHGPMPGFGTVLPGGYGRGGRGRGGPEPLYPDDLERVLKPMGARIISVTTPEVFRRSIAALVEEISATD